MKSYFWKLYSSIIMFFVAMHLSKFFFAQNSMRGQFKAEYLIGIAALVGLIGFAWNKPLFRQWLWKSIFILYVPILIFLQLRNTIHSETVCSEVWCILFYNVLGILLVAPLFIGLFQYAFRSSEIWDKTNLKKSE